MDQPTRARYEEKRTVPASCRAGAFDLGFEWEEEAEAGVRKREAHSGHGQQQIERKIDRADEAWLLLRVAAARLRSVLRARRRGCVGARTRSAD